MVKFSENHIVYEINDTGAYVTGLEEGYPSTLVIPSVVNDHTVLGIKDSAFYIKTITSIQLPDTLISVGTHAFDLCRIENVTITFPDSLETIGSYGFSSNSVEEYIIGKSLKSYGGGALSVNRKLKYISVSKENMYFTSYKGCLYDKSLTTLYCAPPKLNETFKFPESIYCIKFRSFQIKSFKSLTIPQTVAVFESSAFFETTITEVRILGNIVSIDSPFDQATKIKTIIYRGTKVVHAKCIPDSWNTTIYVCAQYRSKYFDTRKVIVQGDCPLINYIPKCCTNNRIQKLSTSILLITLSISS